VATDQSQSTLNGPSLMGTLVLVFLAIAALGAIDTFLAKVEETEGQDEARRLLVEGQRLVQQGHDAEAIDKFRSALSVSRGNQEAQLGLARALLEVGRLTDAETSIQEMLQRNATDGAANVTMARVRHARTDHDTSENLADDSRLIESLEQFVEDLGRGEDNQHRQRDLKRLRGDHKMILAEISIHIRPYGE